jgi:hypothetical protein
LNGAHKLKCQIQPHELMFHQGGKSTWLNQAPGKANENFNEFNLNLLNN